VNATDDRELERYLQGGDSLSRAYAELKSERPTAALDQAVLAQAKAALRPQRPARGGRFFGWPAMTAIAATVLLSFTLVMRVMLESEAPHEAALTAPAASAPAPVSAPASAALKDQAPASTEHDRSLAPPMEPSAPKSSIEKRRQDIEAEIRAASESGPTVDESTAQDAAASNLEQGRAAAAEADVARAAAAPEAAAAREPASAPEPKLARERLKESRPASPEYSATAEGYGLRAESLAKKEQLQPPQEWLQEIERLRASGEAEAADRELERFKQAYPGYLESQASPTDR
jgi:hypothetical protein